MLLGKTVFLSGPISSDPDYYEKFLDAEKLCRRLGARIVYNPARLKQGRPYEWYMGCCLRAIRSGKVHVIVSLQRYFASAGSRIEHTTARRFGLERFKIEELMEVKL